jgi:hypothetical protein
MQVSDSAPGAQPAAAGKEEVRPIGDVAETGARARSGRRFRSALEPKGHDPGTGAHDAASAAAMAGWFRPESAAVPACKTTAVSGPSGARAVDRILVGSGPDGAEARIRIGTGALTGTEIQLSSGAAGHIVEARLLTHAATSRQTLSLVMDEIRLRLRDRGIVLSTTASGTRSVARPGDAEGAGEGATPAGEERARSGR